MFRFQFHRGCPVNLQPSWVARLIIGRGAGYIWGRTLYVARNSASLQWLRQFRDGRPVFRHYPWEYQRIGHIEFGYARNANVVPYIRY